MMKHIIPSVLVGIFLTACFSNVDARTRVSVIEFGKGGAVRRTTSESTATTVNAITSFWSALHGSGRKLQHADMTVVPDLFTKPSGGAVISFTGSGMDLENMELLSQLIGEDGSQGVVGHMEVRGSQSEALLSQLESSVESVEPSSLVSEAKMCCGKPGLSGLKVNVENDNAAIVDQQLGELLRTLEAEAVSAGDTMVLHLVVEEEGSSRHRRLNEDDDRDEGENRNEDENRDNEDGQNNNGNNADGQQYNGYYGYGYYNAYGEWVTPYKTMFQIQYYNVVLWSAIGLTIVLLYTIHLMMNMPLMPDTLLFGESAKLVGDE